MSELSTSIDTTNPPAKEPIWRSPGFWIATFFVLLITMNIAFFVIAGTNPVEFTGK